MKEIEALNPDLVITFSDVQAELAAEILKQGFSVLATNQRTLAETEATLALLGRVVGREVESGRDCSRISRERLAPANKGSGGNSVFILRNGMIRWLVGVQSFGPRVD